jgi:hypothetical protein
MGKIRLANGTVRGCRVYTKSGPYCFQTDAPYKDTTLEAKKITEKERRGRECLDQMN